MTLYGTAAAALTPDSRNWRPPKIPGERSPDDPEYDEDRDGDYDRRYRRPFPEPKPDVGDKSGDEPDVDDF